MDIIDKIIERMFSKGKSDYEISAEVGRSIATIAIRRRVLGLKRKTGKSSIRKELRAKIINLRKQGKPYKQISEELHINKNTVARYCHGAGIGGSRLPRKKYLKVHFNNPYLERSAFVISCGSFYLDALDVPIGLPRVPLVAKITPEKPNRLIVEIFEKSKVAVEKG